MAGRARFATAGKSVKADGLGSPIAADQTLTQNKVYHKTHFVMLGLVPVAFAAHPSALSMPVDVLLALSLPVHAHIGMNWIFTDYVPGSPYGPARIVLFGATVLGGLGLLKLAISGNGIIGTIKDLWGTPAAAEPAKPAKADKKGH